VQDDVKYKKKILAIIEAIVKAKYGKDQKRKTRLVISEIKKKKRTPSFTSSRSQLCRIVTALASRPQNSS
jgi:hypothetical protein